jgi:ribosomal protein S18 acetylase RimI-like enzyme
MVTCRAASTPEDYAAALALIDEYVASLGFDLEFQDFDHERAHLAAEYGPPGGCLLLAETDGELVGCVGVRRFEEQVCEMKRLYVNPRHRRGGVGRTLAAASIEEARRLGYTRMRLDTLPEMEAANALYRALGFQPIRPYRHNPIADALFFELDL